MNIYIYTFKNWLFGLFAKQPFSNLSPPTLCLHPVFCFIVGDKIDDIDDVDDNDNNKIPTFSAENTIK